jgi:sigma-B regulation protein RsbU (phosphoserine phosphatase)
MTLFLGFLDHERHRLRYTSAGHDPPLLYRSASHSIVELAATGLPLGMIPGWCYEEGEEQSIQPGDAILFTTDGVWEARSPSGDRFGKLRLRASLAANAGLTAAEVVAGVLRELEAHMRGRPHEDDITLAVIRRVS